MSATTKADTKAEKALKAATKAVKKAQRAARDASKKAQKKADRLGTKLSTVAKDHDSSRNAAAATAKVGSKSASGAVVTPPLPHPKASPLTLVELRKQAKAKKVAGYSRLNKTALIEALR